MFSSRHNKKRKNPHQNLKEGSKLQVWTYLDGSGPLMEDYFFMEVDLFMEDYLWWKTIFDGRQPFKEDDLQVKKTFNDPSWQMIFDGKTNLHGR